MNPADARTAFDVAEFEARRADRKLGLGSPLTAVALTASTNDDALAAVRAGAPHGATFVADAQSAGRGRRGRTWFAAPAESLLCSVVLRVSLPVEVLGTLALVVGLSVRRAVGEALTAAGERHPVQVKWPNDVWIDGRKVAGVLCESHLQGGVVLGAVVGFGVNVSGRVFPPELSGVATSLALSGAEVSREALLVEVLVGLERRLGILRSEGVVAIAKELSQYDALAGRQVRVDGVVGVAAGVDDDGRLLVRASQGEMLSLAAGSVEVVG